MSERALSRMKSWSGDGSWVTAGDGGGVRGLPRCERESHI